jgi:hypothetical protein
VATGNDKIPHWCETGVFLRMCEDEIYKSMRFAVPFSVITAKLGFLNDASTAALQAFVKTGLRQIDFAGMVSRDRFAVGLPFTNEEGAEVVAERVRRAFIDFQPVVGSATAPNMGADAGNLLMNSDRLAHEKVNAPPARRYA